MSDKPNIILILCDQMRGDAFGADGNPYISTPNIDFLASHGTRFRCGYSAVPSCLPARAILWTGQNQWNAGILGMGWGQDVIPNDYPHTLADELTRGGYRTHLIGKGHFSPQRAMMGFQSIELDESGRTLMNDFKDEYRQWFDGEKGASISPDDHGVNWNSWHARPWHTSEHLHPTAWTMSQSIEFLKNQKESEPFFLNISFARPHSPYVPPKAYWDQYIDAEIPDADIGDWASMHDDPKTAKGPNAWRGNVGKENTRRARAGYFGEISFIDTQIGRLINYMERFCAKQLTNTWFIFTSDHGDMQGDHNLWRKTYAYEGSARIPFLVVPPFRGESPKEQISDAVTELRDIMPTILDIPGLPIPKTVDGASLLPLMEKESVTWRTYIHGEHCRCYGDDQEMQYVTNGKKKFIWLPRINQEQFFDLEMDPHECHNLIHDAQRTSEIGVWRQYLIDELAARDCGWVRDGKLYCPPEAPMVSPWSHKRRE